MQRMQRRYCLLMRGWEYGSRDCGDCNLRYRLFPPVNPLLVCHSSRVLRVLGILGVLGENGQRKGFAQGNFFAHPGEKNAVLSELSVIPVLPAPQIILGGCASLIGSAASPNGADSHGNPVLNPLGRGRRGSRRRSSGTPDRSSSDPLNGRTARCRTNRPRALRGSSLNPDLSGL